MNLLITGSTGFVGRNLLLHALKDPTFANITLPVRNKKKLLQQLQEEGIMQLPKHVHLCSVQNNIWDLTRIFHADSSRDAAQRDEEKEGSRKSQQKQDEISGLETSPEPDLVIHAAGLTFSRAREPYFETHVGGTLELLKVLPPTCRLIILSSLSAAGPTPYDVAARGNHHEARPVSWYGESKLKMEQELLKSCSERLLILRPPIILGPRDTATMLLFQMGRSPLRVKPGLKRKEYSWIDVDDLCRAILIAAKSHWPSSSPYFLTSNQTITDLELLETTAAVLNERGITLRLPHSILQFISFLADKIPALHQPLQSLGRDRIKEILPLRWVADGSKFRRDFKWEPKKELHETLKETARWISKKQ